MDPYNQSEVSASHLRAAACMDRLAAAGVEGARERADSRRQLGIKLATQARVDSVADRAVSVISEVADRADAAEVQRRDTLCKIYDNAHARVNELREAVEAGDPEAQIETAIRFGEARAAVTLANAMGLADLDPGEDA